MCERLRPKTAPETRFVHYQDPPAPVCRNCAILNRLPPASLLERVQGNAPASLENGKWQACRIRPPQKAKERKRRGIRSLSANCQLNTSGTRHLLHLPLPKPRRSSLTSSWPISGLCLPGTNPGEMDSPGRIITRENEQERTTSVRYRLMAKQYKPSWANSTNKSEVGAEPAGDRRLLRSVQPGPLPEDPGKSKSRTDSQEMSDDVCPPGVHCAGRCGLPIHCCSG
jgi:hypothetical protein